MPKKRRKVKKSLRKKGGKKLRSAKTLSGRFTLSGGRFGV